jgi:Zn-dependent protease with chaperone function
MNINHPVRQLVLCLLTLLFAFANPFQSFAQGRDMTKEKEYEAQLSAINPNLVETFKKATAAMDKMEYAFADSLFSSIHRQAPSFIPAVRRLGSIKHALGKEQEGIQLCEIALGMDSSSANILSLAQILVSTTESDPYKKTENLNRALALLRVGKPLDPTDDFDYSILTAEAYFNLNMLLDFKKETRSLLAKHNDKMGAHYFAAIAAASEENWVTAENEILKAKELGLSETIVHGFLNSGVGSNAWFERAKSFFLWILLGWACGFVLLYLFGVFLSNYTLSAIEREFRNKSVSRLAPVLRGVYGFLINTAGIYYYVSLPIILILVVVLVAGIFYMFSMAGVLPIKLLALLGIGALITIYSMIRSLLLKVQTIDPGRKLEESEAPGLFALTGQVAETMGTRPIDEIRITPETDLAVYEQGSWKQKLQDKGKRVLILGTGILKDFKQDEFKAVLAHEYGHFSHRDTAGGAVAMRVRNDMHKYYVTLYNAGQAVVWNMAFLFIRLYDFIFRRISNGSTRLQEVLADRVAAQTYGAQAFENGLTYVIKRNIEFVTLAKAEIEQAKEIKRPFNNLYELAGTPSESFEEELQKSLNRKTTEDDTHPSPADRFRFVKGLGEGKSFNSDVYIRDLFQDWNGLTQEMTKNVEGSWTNT